MAMRKEWKYPAQKKGGLDYFFQSNPLHRGGIYFHFRFQTD